MAQGLADLGVGELSEAAALVALAAPALRFTGLEVPDAPTIQGSYEHALYDTIEARNPRGAHAEYNALLQRMTSFINSYRPP